MKSELLIGRFHFQFAVHFFLGPFFLKVKVGNTKFFTPMGNPLCRVFLPNDKADVVLF